MSALTLWLLFVVIPNVAGMAVALTLLGLAGIVLWLMSHDNEFMRGAGDELLVLTRKRLKKGIITCFILAVLCSMAPSEKQMALIIGGSYATQIEGIEKMPTALVKRLNEILAPATEESK